MVEIIKQLYVGDDASYEKTKGQSGWSWLRCCKEGPGGHRQTLHYESLGAPRGKNYLWVRKGNLLALNLIDVEDPQMIPDEVLDTGVAFIKERMDAGDRVLVACNAGMSRGPTIAMLFLRTIGELDQPFNRARHIFKTLYPKYSPGHGMLFHAMNRWDELKGLYATKHYGPE